MKTSTPHTLKVNEQLYGFTITNIFELPHLKATAYEAIHDYSKAKFLHLHCDDSENLFSIAFRTPPPDNSGVCHIIEHSVLCGSKKFPVKDPFVEMLKGSMATFINALTYPDKTVYPISSNIRQDFFNLMDVYCDAVFNPSISRTTLKQEGHHLAFAEATNPKSTLIIKGIVYNEMKAGYLSLDETIDRTATQPLLPDTPYGFDSGGNPQNIPDLSYEQFVNYHKTHYHPANSYIFTYGDIDTAKHLKFLNKYLSDVPPPPTNLDTTISSQPRWQTPRQITVPYASDEQTQDSETAAFTMNWLTNNSADVMTDQTFELLESILLGDAAAPLRKALVDSKLGQDLTSSGYSNGVMENSFHVGLKGINSKNNAEIKNIIIAELERICKQGISKKQVSTAFRQLRYSHQEIQSSYPLHIMDAIYSSWLYDNNPLNYLHCEKILQTLQNQIEQDPQYLSNFIKKHLINNPHRLDVSIIPDSNLQTKKQNEFEKQMQKIKDNLTVEQKNKIIAEAKELESIQNTPNTPEQLATLPYLKLSDIPKIPKQINTEINITKNNIQLLDNKIFTNGINYLLIAFDLKELPYELVKYIPIFTSIFTKLGTNNYSYTECAELISANTGTLLANTYLGTSAIDPNKQLCQFTIHLKALDQTYNNALQIIQELLTNLNFKNKERLKTLLQQRNIRLQNNITQQGHRFAAIHAARNISASSNLRYHWSGTTQIQLTHKILEKFDINVHTLIAKLETILAHITQHCHIKTSFTGNPHYLKNTQQWLETNFSQNTQIQEPYSPIHLNKLPSNKLNEGLIINTDLSYCAVCFLAPHSSHPDAPYLQVLTQLLTYNYLWEEIRIKGGAYGASCSYNSSAQSFNLLSYRDPNILTTISTFRNLYNHIKNSNWTTIDIQRAIIACTKMDETPIRPNAGNNTALLRHLGGVTQQLRQQRREKLLQVTSKKVKEVALKTIQTGIKQFNLCVLSNKTILKATNKKLTHPLVLQKIIPTKKQS